MKYDIIIVGASFAGLTAAKHLPSQYKILVVDKKEKLNSICESTGLVTTKTKQLLESFVPDLEKYLTNKIDTIGVVSTDFKKHFFSQAKSPWIYSTDTPNLLAHMGSILGDNVEIVNQAEFIDVERKKDNLVVTIKKNNKLEQYESNFLIGADGCRSQVAAKAGLSQNKKFLLGYEKVFFGDILFGENPEKTVYHYWFGEFSLGYGGWLSPTLIDGKKAFRVGLAKLEKNQKDILLLNKFVEKLIKIGHIKIHGNELYQYGGYVPLDGVLSKLYNDRVIMVGDAAGFCGAFAADGIKGALASGMVSARLIDDYLKNNNDSIFDKYKKKMNEYEKMITYFKKQKLYRFIWNNMKKNATFQAMYEVIAADKKSFISQFSDAKNTGSGLSTILFKLNILPKVIWLGILWLCDFLFKK